MIEIPFNNEASKQRVIVSINGQDLAFRAAWNTVTRSWYLSVYTAQGDAIVKGRRLCALAFPLSTPDHVWRSYLREPDGRSGAIVGLASAADPLADPGRNDLGSSYRVLYLTADDLDALRGA